MENRDIFLDFSQIIAHRNLHIVKTDLRNTLLNGELLAIIASRTSGISSKFVGVENCHALVVVHLHFFAKTWLPRFQFF